MRAVLGEHDNIAMVDLEQQYWPYFWWPGWPPLAIWVHIILTLENADTTLAGEPDPTSEVQTLDASADKLMMLNSAQTEVPQLLLSQDYSNSCLYLQQAC